MDVIQPWVVGPVDSPYDLDNIRLVDISKAGDATDGLSADFQLQYILVE